MLSHSQTHWQKKGSSISKDVLISFDGFWSFLQNHLLTNICYTFDLPMVFCYQFKNYYNSLPNKKMLTLIRLHVSNIIFSPTWPLLLSCTWLMNLVKRGSLNMEQDAVFNAAFIGTLTFRSYSGDLRMELISFFEVKGSSNFEGHIKDLANNIWLEWYKPHLFNIYWCLIIIWNIVI